MRRLFVILLLCLFPFQVFAARMDCRLSLAVMAAAATGVGAAHAQAAGAATAGALEMRIDRNQDQAAATATGLDADACDDSDEASANADPGDTLVAAFAAPSLPRAMLARPERTVPALPSRYPAVPKPPPEA